MEGPFAITRAIPKLYGIIVVFIKEFSKFARNQHYMNLKWVWQWVEYSFYSMNRVGNNDDSPNIRQVSGLVNATSNSKHFSFSVCDVYGMVDSLDNWSIVNMNAYYGGGDLILDTNIRYNNSIFWVC